MADLPVPLKVNQSTRTLQLSCPSVMLYLCSNLSWRPLVIVWSLAMFLLGFFSLFKFFFSTIPCKWSVLAVKFCGYEQNWAGDHFVGNYIGSGGKCFLSLYVTFEASAFGSCYFYASHWSLFNSCSSGDTQAEALEDLWYYLSTLC